MNVDIVKGKWHEMKGQVRQQWAKLTDDDIEAIAGSREELEGRLCKNYGYAKDAAGKAVDAFIGEHGFDKKSDSEE